MIETWGKWWYKIINSWVMINVVEIRDSKSCKSTVCKSATWQDSVSFNRLESPYFASFLERHVTNPAIACWHVNVSDNLRVVNSEWSYWLQTKARNDTSHTMCSRVAQSLTDKYSNKLVSDPQIYSSYRNQ